MTPFPLSQGYLKSIDFKDTQASSLMGYRRHPITQPKVPSTTQRFLSSTKPFVDKMVYDGNQRRDRLQDATLALQAVKDIDSKSSPLKSII